jgi:hypothetical protein
LGLRWDTALAHGFPTNVTKQKGSVAASSNSCRRYRRGDAQAAAITAALPVLTPLAVAAATKCQVHGAGVDTGGVKSASLAITAGAVRPDIEHAEATRMREALQS